MQDYAAFFFCFCCYAIFVHVAITECYFYHLKQRCVISWQGFQQMSVNCWVCYAYSTYYKKTYSCTTVPIAINEKSLLGGQIYCTQRNLHGCFTPSRMKRSFSFHAFKLLFIDFGINSNSHVCIFSYVYLLDTHEEKQKNVLFATVHAYTTALRGKEIVFISGLQLNYHQYLTHQLTEQV